jgi:hypothetical protein
LLQLQLTGYLGGNFWRNVTLAYDLNGLTTTSTFVKHCKVAELVVKRVAHSVVIQITVCA